MDGICAVPKFDIFAPGLNRDVYGLGNGGPGDSARFSEPSSEGRR